ncbi:unnamed protein product, partial [Medioppia subpectinata]
NEMDESCDERAEELEEVRADDREDIEMREEDETNEAITTIPAEEKDWDVYNDGVIVVNQAIHKRKGGDEEAFDDQYCEDDNEMDTKKKSKLCKGGYSKRAYTPRSSSPLPPAGESKVVVQLLYGSKQWKRTMDGDIKSIIRDMALRRPDPAGRKIAASDKLCAAVMKNHSKRLVSECKEAARTMRVPDHQDVTQLDMKSFTSEVFMKCPKTANLIKSLIPVEPRDTLDEHSATALIMDAPVVTARASVEPRDTLDEHSATALIMGVILYMHSMQSNTLQHILSYVLRRAGCNREGFKFLHSLGLTLSYTSILKIMNDIDAKPDIEKSSLDTIEKSIDSVVVRTKIEAKNDSKKKSSQVVNQETTQVGDPVLLQFTLPYYQTTTFTTSRNPSVTYTTNQLSNSNQTTYTAVPFEATDSSTVYSSQ